MTSVLQMEGWLHQLAQTQAEPYNCFRLTPDLSCILNPNCLFYYVNDAWQAVLGWQFAELENLSWSAWLHPDDRLENERCFSTWKETEAQPPLCFTSRMRHQDGSYRSLLWHWCRLEGGFWAGIAQDVTMSQQEELALKASQQQLQAILDYSPLSIFFKDLEGRYIRVNRRTEIFTQLTSEQIVGRTDDELFPPAIARELLAHDRFVIETNEAHEWEEIIPEGDDLRVNLTTKFPLRDVTGAPHAVCGIAIDVTKLKRTEQQLYQREQEFRALVENAPDVISRFDRNLRYLYISPAIERATGLPPDLFIGKTDREVGFLGEVVDDWTTALETVFVTGQEQVFEFCFPTSQGQQYYQALIKPEFGIDGSVITLLTISRDLTSIKQVEADLRISEQKYRSLTENLGDGIYLVDADFEVLYLNRAIETIFGQTRKELYLNRPFGFLNCIHPEDIDRVRAAFYTAHWTADRLEVNYRIIRPNGEVRYVRDALQVNRDEQGKIENYLGIISDITHIRQAEVALRKSERRYAILTERSPAGIFRADSDGSYLYVNPRWCEMAGMTPTEAFGSGWERALHPDDRDRVVQQWHDTTLTGQVFATDYRFCKQDGTVTWLVAQAVPEQDEAGKVLGYIGTLTDITDRKCIEEERQHAEDSLRISEAQLRAIFEQAAVGIAQTDLSGCFLQTNQRLCEMLGYTEAELLERSSQSITHPADLVETIQKTEQLLSGNIQNVFYEKRFIAKDQRIIWARISVSVVRHETGIPQYFIKVIEDITERKQAEAQLQTSLAEKELLLKEIHHRVKNNLQMIHSLLDLPTYRTSDSQVLNILQDSQSRIKSMALVHEILYYSRGVFQINLAQYIQSLATTLFHTYNAAASLIHLDLDIQPDIMIGLDQAIPCGLILNELITNALKYGFTQSKDRALLIKLKKDYDHRVRIEVTNPGDTLSEEFDVGSVKTLGLQLVTTLVTQLRGNLSVVRGDQTAFIIDFFDVLQ